MENFCDLSLRQRRRKHNNNIDFSMFNNSLKPNDNHTMHDEDVEELHLLNPEISIDRLKNL